MCEKVATVPASLKKDEVSGYYWLNHGQVNTEIRQHPNGRFYLKKKPMKAHCICDALQEAGFST